MYSDYVVWGGGSVEPTGLWMT